MYLTATVTWHNVHNITWCVTPFPSPSPHTTTYPICDCRYQLAVSETPSHFCEWTIVSDSRISSTSQQTTSIVSSLRYIYILFFSYFFHYIYYTIIYLLDRLHMHTVTTKHITMGTTPWWIATSPPHHQHTQRQKGLEMYLEPFVGFFFFIFFLQYQHLFMIRPHHITLTCLTQRLLYWHIQPAPKWWWWPPWPPYDERGLGRVSSLCCVSHHHRHQHHQLFECVTLGKGESIAQEMDNAVSWASR